MERAWRNNCLTSSISSCETLLLSLLDTETEFESGTAVSVTLFGCSNWDSCDTWLAGFISDVLCESCKGSMLIMRKGTKRPFDAHYFGQKMHFPIKSHGPHCYQFRSKGYDNICKITKPPLWIGKVSRWTSFNEGIMVIVYNYMAESCTENVRNHTVATFKKFLQFAQNGNQTRAKSVML